MPCVHVNREAVRNNLETLGVRNQSVLVTERGHGDLSDGNTQRVEWQFWTQQLAPYGETIGGVVSHWLEHTAPFKHAPNIRDCVEEYLRACVVLGRSQPTIYSNRSVLGRLADELGGELPSNVTRAAIETALRKPCRGQNTPLSPTTLKTRILRVNGFFAWCIDQGYCLENPCGRIAFAKQRWREPETYSLAELAALLAYAKHAGVCRVFVLGVFCALRPSEAARCKPSDLNLAENALCITSEKTGKRRRIELLPVAAAWLRKCAKEPWEHKDLPRRIAEIYQGAKVLRKYDALRHSAASYLSPVMGLAWVSELLDHHDLATAKQHYLGIRTKAEAQEFLKLMPD